MARSLALLLKKAGCETQVVHDGAAALEVANSFPPQVVLLDIGLPGLDGYEVARRFRADPQHADVRLIAVSGYGQLQDQKRSKDAGFNHHLVKPVALRRPLGHARRISRSRLSGLIRRPCSPLVAINNSL